MSQATWRKSSFSGGGGNGGGECVELAHFPTTVAIRDSKAPHTPPLHISPTTFTALITTLK